MTTKTITKSNPFVLSSRIADDGTAMQTLKCLGCGSPFERVQVRGVRPFFGEPCGCADEYRGKRVTVTTDGDVTETTDDVVETPKETEAPKNDEPIRIRHKMQDALERIVSANVIPYLYGPAGSGKSKGARNVAEALNLHFAMESLSIGTDETAFFGYVDANGRYVTTEFRNVFENGGLYLLDEMDAGNPYVLARLNGALAMSVGETLVFPDGPVKRHPEARFIAAGNTIGKGADEKYVGRQPLDAATMNRFAFINWSYDETLELCLVGDPESLADMARRKFEANGRRIPAVDWAKRVIGYRHAINATEADLLATPRATLMGVSLFDQGFGLKDIEAMTIWQGADDDTINTVQAEYNRVARDRKASDAIDSATAALKNAF